MTVESIASARAELGERQDCSIKAIALVTSLPYRTVHAEFAKAGRKKGTGTYRSMQRRVLMNLGFKAIVDTNPRQPNGSRYTPKTIHRFCNTGAWLAYKRGHVFAIVDGEVIDWTAGRKHHITEAWRIKKI